jgi:hypothetical protein
MTAYSNATARWDGVAAGRESVQRLRTTSDVHAREGTLVAGGGDATAQRGDAAAARCSNGGRRVLGDVLGGDERQIG